MEQELARLGHRLVEAEQEVQREQRETKQIEATYGELLSAARIGSVHPLAADTVAGSLGRRWRFPEQARAMVLTDDYNPIEFFEASLRESVRETILRSTPHALLGDDAWRNGP